MEEQEEGIFAEIKKHSDDTIIGCEMTNNKGKIVEVIGVENKTVNNDNDDSVVVVEKGRETDQSNENKGYQGTDNAVSYTHLPSYPLPDLFYLFTLFHSFS